MKWSRQSNPKLHWWFSVTFSLEQGTWQGQSRLCVLGREGEDLLPAGSLESQSGVIQAGVFPRCWAYQVPRSILSSSSLDYRKCTHAQIPHLSDALWHAWCWKAAVAVAQSDCWSRFGAALLGEALAESIVLPQPVGTPCTNKPESGDL